MEVLVPRGKGGASPSRYLPIDTELRIAMEKWMALRDRLYAENPYLLPSRRSSSGHLEVSQVGNVFRRLCLEAGITHTKLHECRNTCEIYLARGLNTNEIDYVLGHTGTIGKLYFEKIKNNPQMREEFRKKFSQHCLKVGIDRLT